MAIKNNSKKEKFNKKQASENAIQNCPVFPVFCFSCITNNNHYNFEFYKNDKEKNNALSELYEKIQFISGYTWKEFMLLRKEIGMETIPISQLNFAINDKVGITITHDEKFISIRFGNQDKRLIGIKRSGCPILYIIGFDFDFSAYKH